MPITRHSIVKPLRSVLAAAVVAFMFPCAAAAAEVQDTVSAEFFRTRLHSGDLVAWMQGYSDYVTYEGNYQGQWSQGDQLLFAVNGNSYRWNRFYLDGFRTNSRLHTGSTLYVPNMEHYGMSVDVHNSTLSFTRDDSLGDYVQLSGNVGNLGGVNPTTVGIIHTFHETGSERCFDPATILSRQHVRGAATVDAAFTLGRAGADGRWFRQHIVAAMGNRRLPQYDQNGLCRGAELYGANYYKLQADGQLPTSHARHFDRAGYLFNVSGKDDGLSEFYYNRNEQPHQLDLSASLYGTRQRGSRSLTTGVTWSMQRLRHDDIGFRRNVIDQDGESLEPWTPDGRTHELSWALNWQTPLRPWLRFTVETYNSLIAYRPTQSEWSNDEYLQHANAPGAATSEVVPLYRYSWHSQAFGGAILENLASLRAHKALGRKADLDANVGLSLDGILLNSHSKVTPNVEAGISLTARPLNWLDVALHLQHSRVGYDIETLRFMSDKYLSGDVYSHSTQQLLNTTGGAHHRFASGTWQPSVVSLFIPIRLHYGRHEIALLQTYKKFCNVWMVQYAGGADANGTYIEAEVPEPYRRGADSPSRVPVFFPSPGAHDYEVGGIPDGMMGDGLLTGTPYYISQQTRYSYHGRRLYVSVAWQSMMGAGPSALGCGPGSNNIGILSETTANPNTHRVLENLQGKYPAVSRYDQDRAYIARLAFAYNVNSHIELGANGSWTDGQPFAFYHVYRLSQLDGSGSPSVDASSPITGSNPPITGSGEQVAIFNTVSRGINPTDGNFGCRESAIFHIDVHARFSWTTRGYPMSLRVQSYNVYDFGNALNEMCFPQGAEIGRGRNFCLTIPRGLLFTLNVKL